MRSCGRAPATSQSQKRSAAAPCWGARRDEARCASKTATNLDPPREDHHHDHHHQQPAQHAWSSRRSCGRALAGLAWSWSVVVWCSSARLKLPASSSRSSVEQRQQETAGEDGGWWMDGICARARHWTGPAPRSESVMIDLRGRGAAQKEG